MPSVPENDARILLLAADEKQRRLLTQTLRCLVKYVDVADDLDQISDKSPYALVIVEYDRLTEADRERVKQNRSGTFGRAKLLLVSEGRVRVDFVSLFSGGALTNLLARNTEVDSRDLIVTVQKMLGGDIFGLEKYLSPEVDPVHLTIRRSSEKAKVLAAVGQFSRRIEIRPRMANLLYGVADELVTNAIYNAPLNSDGGHRFARASRCEEAVLEPHEEVKITLCFDGERLGISASDPFGSLSPELVQRHLANGLRRGGDQVKQEGGGAGLGLYHVFESVSRLVLNLSTGKRTEIIGLFEVGGRHRDFVKKAKSFNIFVGEI